jgi:hypothetical protein
MFDFTADAFRAHRRDHSDHRNDHIQLDHDHGNHATAIRNYNHAPAKCADTGAVAGPRTAPAPTDDDGD